MKFLEVSALTNEDNCVNKAFKIIIEDSSEKLYEKKMNKDEEDSKILLKKQKIDVKTKNCLCNWII